MRSFELVYCKVTAIAGPDGKEYGVAAPVAPVPDGIRARESITFTLGTAWHGKGKPVKGQVYPLSDVRETDRGMLRAHSVTPAVPVG